MLAFFAGPVSAESRTQTHAPLHERPHCWGVLIFDPKCIEQQVGLRLERHCDSADESDCSTRELAVRCEDIEGDIRDLGPRLCA